MYVILYTTHCPKCNVLKKKLDLKGLSYIECDDISTINELGEQLGFNEAPILQVNDCYYGYVEAVRYINSL